MFDVEISVSSYLFCRSAWHGNINTALSGDVKKTTGKKAFSALQHLLAVIYNLWNWKDFSLLKLCGELSQFTA